MLDARMQRDTACKPMLYPVTINYITDCAYSYRMQAAKKCSTVRQEAMLPSQSQDEQNMQFLAC